MTHYTKRRLDLLVMERGLAESRSQAQALLLAGKIRAPGLSQVKPGALVSSDQTLELVQGSKFVSRGGEKLEGALQVFGIDVKDRLCWDVGASTGGFTDCLLKRGARRVLAVDVGHGQLHWRLRQDPRVLSSEKTHVLSLTAEDAAAHPPALVTVDVSFISLEKVLPHLAGLLAPGAEVVALVKPQFEAGPRQAPKGVVRDPRVRARVIDRIIQALPSWGFHLKDQAPSCLKGPKGNQEHFLYFVKEQEN